MPHVFNGHMFANCEWETIIVRPGEHWEIVTEILRDSIVLTPIFLTQHALGIWQCVVISDLVFIDSSMWSLAASSLCVKQQTPASHLSSFVCKPRHLFGLAWCMDLSRLALNYKSDISQGVMWDLCRLQLVNMLLFFFMADNWADTRIWRCNVRISLFLKREVKPVRVGRC